MAEVPVTLLCCFSLKLKCCGDNGVEQYTVLDHMGTHFCNRLFEWSNIKSFGISVTSKVLCLAACSWGVRISWRFCGRCRAARQCVFCSQKKTVHDCKGFKNCPRHSTLKQACVLYVSTLRVNKFLDKDSTLPFPQHSVIQKVTKCQKQRCVHYCWHFTLANFRLRNEKTW